VPISRVQRPGAYAQKEWLRCLVILLVGVAVRAPALPGQLIWDDQFLAHDSPFIKSPLLILESFRHYLFPDAFSAHYRPVQNLSFIFDYFFWNTNTFGYHLTNVILHATSAVLLYLLLRRLFSGLLTNAGSAGKNAISAAAFFAATLWSVHPVHSAAVDYISGRADSLAALFACGAWLLFIAASRARLRRSRVTFFTLAAFAALFALCSRETAGLWLLIFLLHQLFFDHAMSRRAKIAVLIGVFCIFASYLGLRQLPGPRSSAAPTAGWPPTVRAVLMLRALGDYGRLMVFPANLHMERNIFDRRNYGGVENWRRSVETEYLSIAGLILIAGVGAACHKHTSGQRMRIFGAIWFFLAYLPTSNIVDLNATVAEHWLYLPSVGLLIFAAGCALDFPSRYRRGLAAFASVAIVAIGARSVRRSSDWVTPETFYQRTIVAGGGSARLSTNLASVYANRRDYEKAEAILRKVLENSPDFPVARNNLADILNREGKKTEAEAMFSESNAASAKARKDYPHTWIAALNLAHLQHAKGEGSSALAVLEQARADYPHIWEIISFEAEVLRQTQGPEAALQIVNGFTRDNWWHYKAAIARARLLAEKGETEEAVRALRFASWLDVNDTEALNTIAGLRVRENRFEDAYAVQCRALARQPDQPRQYLLLSNILEKLGRHEEALVNVAQVERLQALAQASTLN
jgi:tetratricopeptide (TPR) repeat protein